MMQQRACLKESASARWLLGESLLRIRSTAGLAEQHGHTLHPRESDLTSEEYRHCTSGVYSTHPTAEEPTAGMSLLDV